MSVTMISHLQSRCRWGIKNESRLSRPVTSDRHGAGRAGWVRRAGAAAGMVGLIAGGVTVGGVAAAGAAGIAVPAMSITASTSTTVGLQVFANVNLTGGANPTGTVTFKLFSPSDSSCNSAIYTSTVAVAGQSFNSDRYTTTAAGTYRWEATYNGDANNAVVGPTACATASAAVVVSRVMAGVSVSAPAPVGGSIHVNVVLNGYSPTGTLSAFLTPPGDTFCSGTPVFSPTFAVNGSGSYSSPSYTPTVSGSYKWRVSYSGDANNNAPTISGCLDANAAVSVTVGSSGSAPTVSLNPTAVSFASQSVGTTSSAVNVTLSNSGNAALTITSVNVVGTDPTEFGVNASCTGATLAPGGTCNMAVTFAPAAAGNRSASISVADNASGSPQTVALTGTGATASAQNFTYPLDGQAGVDTSRPFTWSAAPSANYYDVYIGTALGAFDLADSGVLQASQLSYAVPSLPAGPTLYAKIWSYINGTWTGQSITFTASAPRPTIFTYPTEAQTGVDTSKPFSWSSVPTANYYDLYIGTTVGGYDLADSGVLPANQLSYTVAALPTGPTLYAKIWVYANNVWTGQSISFTTALPKTAVFTYPVDGQTAVDTTRPFTWSTSPTASYYDLMIGTTPGGADLVNSGVVPPNQSSFVVPALPAGQTLYGRIWTYVNGAWVSQSVTFTARAR
jgi:hypothetical protein